MKEDRFKESLPIIILFLIASAVFSYTIRNVWWFIGGLTLTGLVYVLSRLGER